MADLFMKDPSAVLDYAVDWTGWLAEGETIGSFPVTVDAGLTVAQAATHSAGVVTVWLSGGTAGKTYTVTSRVTTNQGRTDDRSIRIRVEER